MTDKKTKELLEQQKESIMEIICMNWPNYFDDKFDKENQEYKSKIINEIKSL